MIISHKYGFIFLKTNKTAGTSIEIALSRFCGDKDIITPLTSEDEKIRKNLGYKGPQNYLAPLKDYSLKDVSRLLFNKRRRRKTLFYKHIPARLVKETIGDGIWKSYTKFCFERNPWDRFISYYYYKTTMLNLDPLPTISEFLRTAYPLELKKKGYEVYTINGEVVVDKVCRYENLAEELEEIRVQLGLPEPLVLPITKSNYRKDSRSYREILTAEQRTMIAEMFQDEINLLNYTF